MEIIGIVLKYALIVIAIAITFGLSIFVHEFGHMIFALMRGVGVESFALGMGPKITQWYWGGIEFSLRWFPVGGFVKLKGMIPDEEEAKPVASSETPATADPATNESQNAEADKNLGESAYEDLLALHGKGTLTKIMVFGGGVFMNYIAAILATVVVLWYPHKVDLFPTEVEIVESVDAELLAGIQPGDTIVAVNGEPVQYRHEFYKQLDRLFREAPKVEGEKAIRLTLSVQRNGETKTLEPPVMNKERFEEFLGGFKLRSPALVGAVIPTFPAHRAGIENDDRITAINGQPVNTFHQIFEIVSKNLDQEITVQVERDGQTLELQMTPKEGYPEPEDGTIGILPGSSETMVIREVDSIWKAIVMAPRDATERLLFLSRMTFEFFSQASLRQIKDNLGGPIMIVGMTASAAKEGFPVLLQWFVTLNLLLLFFNLLPIPVLDGGFIVITLIEAIIRRPVPPKILGPIYTVFVVFFIGFIVLISILDIQKWFF